MVQLRIRDLWELIKETIWAWSDDYAPSMGAALAFYTIFSIAPVLVIVLAIAGFIFGEEAARGELFSRIGAFLGEEAAVAVQGIVREAGKPGRGIVAAVSGGVAMIIGATTVFAELQSDLNRIWRAPGESGGGWLQIVTTRLTAFVLVLGIALLLLVAIVASTALSIIGAWWSTYLGGWSLVLQVLNFAVMFAAITTSFALIYRYVPEADVAWRDVWLGAAVTAVLFTIGRYLIGLYLSTAGVGSGFGAAGSLVILLMWVYYSAQVFLLGAEFTWVYARRYGSRSRGGKR
jgi:membrane protein